MKIKSWELGVKKEKYPGLFSTHRFKKLQKGCDSIYHKDFCYKKPGETLANTIFKRNSILFTCEECLL